MAKKVKPTYSGIGIRFLETPDLSRSFNPVPKPAAKEKSKPKPLGVGKKTEEWEEGRQELKAEFKENGVTSCELELQPCKHTNFLGFAHTRRRNTLTKEQVVSSKFVVLACQPCHHVVDFEMDRAEAERLMDSVVAGRGW